MPTATRPILIGAGLAATLALALHPLAGRADDGALAERVQRLEDREEIRSLIIAYGRALDQRDFAAFARLFAKTDGEWVGGFGTAKGQAAIQRMMETRIGSNKTGAPPASFHILSNDDITVSGDRGSAVTKWVFVRQNDAGKPEWVFLGHYDDTFIREGGHWRFLRREAFTDIPVQAAPALPAQGR
jgi:SnoaL-like domain